MDWNNEYPNNSFENPVPPDLAASQQSGAPEQTPPYQESAYHDTYTPPYTVPNQQPFPKPKKPKKSASGLGAKIVALGLVCGLIGSLGGGAIVAAVMSRDDDASQGITAPEKEQAEQENVATSTIIQNVTTNSGAMTPAQVYDKYVSAVVGISNEVTSTNVFGQVSATASTGSGFIISEDGYIVTNYHVVSGAQTLKATLYDGSEYPATLVGYESTNDVALLKIDATGLTAVAIGDSDTLGVGDCVAAIGNPLGELTYTMTVGYISATDREINTDGTPINMLQTDAAINSGNSGGPLFDMNGNVVGITTAKYSGSTSTGTTIEGIGFAIPINDVMKLLPDLEEYGYVTGQAYLGISVRDLDSSTAEIYSLPLGAYVLSVEEGSCAAKAGLVGGDIITGIDDAAIESYTDLVAALKNYSAGDTVTLTVYRSGQSVELTITLDEKAHAAETDAQTQQEQPQQEPQQGAQNPFRYFFGQ